MSTDTRAVAAKKEGMSFEVVSPINHLTRPVNRAVWGFITYIFNHFTFALGVYISAVILLNIPLIEVKPIYIALVNLSPILVPCVLMVSYAGIGLVILFLFAKDLKTRIACAIIIEVFFIVPWLLITLLDTPLFLQLGDFFAFSLFVGNILLMVWFIFRYGRTLYKKTFYKETWASKAHLFLYTLMLILLFTWFESSQGFSYTRISKDHFITQNYELYVPKDKNGNPRGTPYYVCEVLLDYNGKKHIFQNMKIPNGLEPSIQYLELRQAVFQHLNLR